MNIFTADLYRWNHIHLYHPQVEARETTSKALQKLQARRPTAFSTPKTALHPPTGRFLGSMEMI